MGTHSRSNNTVDPCSRHTVRNPSAPHLLTLGQYIVVRTVSSTYYLPRLHNKPNAGLCIPHSPLPKTVRPKALNVASQAPSLSTPRQYRPQPPLTQLFSSRLRHFLHGIVSLCEPWAP